MIETVAELVAHHPLFAGLEPSAVELVADCAVNAVFDAGRLLIAEGDDADTLYLMRRGTVTIELHDPGRPQRVVERVGPGAVVGWSWLFPPYRWRFDVRADGPVGAIAVDAACLRAKAEAQPAFGYHLALRLGGAMLERLDGGRIRLLDLYGEDVP